MIKLPDFSKDIAAFLTELREIRSLLEQLLEIEKAKSGGDTA